MSRWSYALKGWFWDHSQLWRRPARRLRQVLSNGLYRWRHFRVPQVPRVIPRHADDDGSPWPADFAHPAVAVRVSRNHADRAAAWLARQTETSTTLVVDDGPLPDPVPKLWLDYGPELEALPESLLESLLLSAASEGCRLTVAGWGPLAPSLAGPRGELFEATPRATLIRLGEPSPNPKIIGRVVPHLGEPAAEVSEAAPRERPTTTLACAPGSQASGPYLLRGDVAAGTLVAQPLTPPHRVLAQRSPQPGTPTFLFLLPFLAVGGAERLLYDLLAGLCPTHRCLVVTMEPHRRELGQTVDVCRRLTPHLYTLGDWLPRPSLGSAVEHLLDRYQVTHLVCWNGVVAFYDEVRRWRRRFPALRIFNQLYNHRGGWIEHYGRRFIDAVDVHIAINGAIADALAERGVPKAAVATVHHGVEIPPLTTDGQRRGERQRARHTLGLDRLDANTVVVGTFIRLHPQKRPLDILATARRLAGHDVHFLLVGGGPLDDEIDRRLTASPLPNLTRLGLRDDLGTLYAAIDLCLMTSDYEGLPVFLLDGLARGLPCVATAVGEIPELLADGGGVLVGAPGDVEALARGVEDLLDGDRRRREGLRGRRTVAARFGLDTYRRRYGELFFPDTPAETGAETSPTQPPGVRR